LGTGRLHRQETLRASGAHRIPIAGKKGKTEQRCRKPVPSRLASHPLIVSPQLDLATLEPAGVAGHRVVDVQRYESLGAKGKLLRPLAREVDQALDGLPRGGNKILVANH